MRFGIGEKSDHTLEEVGQDFEVTRERIRQIEAKALRKLRHPSRSEAAQVRSSRADPFRHVLPGAAVSPARRRRSPFVTPNVAGATHLRPPRPQPRRRDAAGGDRGPGPAG